MKDVNGQSEITQSIEVPISEMRTKRKRILLAETRGMRKTTKNIGVSASELTREDRESR